MDSIVLVASNIYIKVSLSPIPPTSLSPSAIDIIAQDVLIPHRPLAACSASSLYATYFLSIPLPTSSASSVDRRALITAYHARITNYIIPLVDLHHRVVVIATYHARAVDVAAFSMSSTRHCRLSRTFCELSSPSFPSIIRPSSPLHDQGVSEISRIVC